MRLVKSSEIQEMDRITIQEMGIPGVVLMENAARAASRVFLDHFHPPLNSHILVLCGRGNNGGDGYVMARYLHQAGLQVTVIVLAETASIEGDALLNLEVIRRLGVPVVEVGSLVEWGEKSGLVSSADYIIDGILGTGLNAPVRGMYKEIIQTMNQAHKPVMAIDIPSGLHADTGQVMGVAVRADLTVTFGFPKAGQLVFPGAELVGRLVCVNIGIPHQVADRLPVSYRLIGPEHFLDLLQEKGQDIHKGDRGHLLILAGSTGKTGAASLAALGALRGGAGLVTLGTPQSLNAVLEEKLTEAMTVPLPDTTEGFLSLQAEEQIGELMKGKSAVALGPGLSTHPETSALVRRVIAGCSLPMVIDADGLNALSGDISVIEHCSGRVVLTPHPGEMGRLSGLTSLEVQRDRLGCATRFASQHGCILVLKGARTVIAQPEGPTFINPTGNPALSSGGSGDVLTGLIGGYLARGWPPTEAALAGVFLHGLSADFLAETMGQAGILAGELLEVVPPLMESLLRGEWPLKSPPLQDDLRQPL